MRQGSTLIRDRDRPVSNTGNVRHMGHSLPACRRPGARSRQQHPRTADLSRYPGRDPGPGWPPRPGQTRPTGTRAAPSGPDPPAGDKGPPHGGQRPHRAAQEPGGYWSTVAVSRHSSSARWMAGRPRRSATWVRQENPSASTTASGAASSAGSRFCSATATETS